LPRGFRTWRIDGVLSHRCIAVLQELRYSHVSEPEEHFFAPDFFAIRTPFDLKVIAWVNINLNEVAFETLTR
jgi:hypothetical protein